MDKLVVSSYMFYARSLCYTFKSVEMRHLSALQFKWIKEVLRNQKYQISYKEVMIKFNEFEVSNVAM